MKELHWTVADTSGDEQIEALAAALERGPLASQLTLLQDPRWLAALALSPDKSVRAYVLRSEGDIVGFAGFLVHPSALRLSLGEATLLSRPVRHLRSFAAPLVAGAPDEGREQAALAGLLHCMRADLASDEVVFLESVIDGTALWRLLKGREAGRTEFHVMQNGNPYQHRSAALPDSLEAYLKQLGPKTRADLRSTRKKFIAHVDGRYVTRCFRTPDETAEFAADAVSVSANTYQYHVLGAGLRDRDELERKYRRTAVLGWFRSYILYADGRPIAFQAGHLYRDRYHAQHIGYDPAWARHHVGIFLHTEIVSDLAGSGEGVRWFDFGIGDTQHKQRLSTTTSAGGYFYLIPDTFSGSLFAGTLRVTNRVSSGIGALLDRFGWRQRVRQLLRRLGAAR